MQKGGYQIIDLSGYPFHIDKTAGTQGENTVPGIFKKIKSSKKALLFSGVTIDDTSTLSYPTGVIRDVFLSNIQESQSYLSGYIYMAEAGDAMLSTLYIKIDNNDVVKLQYISPTI